MDINLSTTPTPVDSNVFAVHSFLRLAQANSQFATETLRILTEERRTYHRERANKSRTQQLFELHDIVMVRVQVQSNMETNRVAKLSYRLRGPYSIIEVLGNGAYLVQKVNKPDSPKLKYHTQDISFLPPAIRPVEPLDGPDLRYLNHSFAPIPDPLKSAFNINRYNFVWFSEPISKQPPSFTQIIVNPTALQAIQPDCSKHSPVTATDIRHDMHVSPTVIDDLLTTPQPTLPSQLYVDITTSVDRLFFISYTNLGTIRPRWFLIFVDLPQTELDPRCTNHIEDGVYYCHFLHRHPDDKSEQDQDTRWWPEWHQYTKNTDRILD
jgi:hypothetical protein